jgi:hypothetical protein
MCVDRLLISRHRQIKARVSYVQRERQRLKVFEDGRVSGSIRSVSFDPDTQAVCVCVSFAALPHQAIETAGYGSKASEVEACRRSARWRRSSAL